MRRLNNISRRRLEEIIREEVQIKVNREKQEEQSFKLFESKMKDISRTLFESRQDLESKIVIKYLENSGNSVIKDPMSINEGLWDKAKNMLAKLRLSKSSGAEEQRGELQAAADSAASKEFNGLFSQIKALPGFDRYPNNTEQEEFDGITMGLGLLWHALEAAHKAGLVETETANGLIDKLKTYVDGLNKDLSYSYRYLKEEDDEIEQLDEKVFTNYNRLDKMLDALKDGTQLSDKQYKYIAKQFKKLDKEFANKGGEAGEYLNPDDVRGWTNKEADFHDRMQKMGFGDKAETPPVPEPEPPVPEPEPPVPEPEPPVPETPPDPIKGWCGGPGQPECPESFGGDIGARSTGIGDIGGVQDIGRLYRKAGSVSTLMSWLGPGFLKSVAAFALPVAGIGAIVGLLGKRFLGHSREGALKNVSKTMVPLDAGDHATEQEKLDEPDVPVDPADPTAPADPTDPTAPVDPNAPGGGKGDVHVFRNPADGQGMQSKFAKSGIKGKDMSRLMKGLRADLTAAGFNVLEEARRETISLENTIAAVEQIADEAQKEVAKAAIVKLLRQHKIVGDQTASMALKPGAAAQDPRHQKAVDMATALQTGEPLPDASPDPDPTPGHADAVQKGVDQLKALKKGPTAPAAPAGGKNKGYDAMGAYAQAAGVPPAEDEEDEEEVVQETFSRWHKLAGILKG